MPSAAHASSKLTNEKPLFADRGICSVSPGFAPAAPADRTRIILGGAPSALDRIRSDQQNAPGAAATPAPAAVPTPAGLATPIFQPLEPASRNPVSLAMPQAQGCAALAASRNTGGQSPAVASASADPEYDPTSELGTRPIPVKRTRFDSRWDQVRRAAPAALMHAQLGRANATPGLAEAALLARVNQWVNGKIDYVNDDVNYRQRDFWANAEQTIARGSGDCEDFAILKMQMLRAAGVDADRMKLVLLRDLAANADHAFLLVQTGGGKVVLDNVTDRLYDGSQSNSVRPVLSFSENRRWIHAYRGAPSSPNAVAVPASRKPMVLALNNQRSVKADPLTFKTGFNR